jgi:hypothetical protein
MMKWVVVFLVHPDSFYNPFLLSMKPLFDKHGAVASFVSSQLGFQ